MYQACAARRGQGIRFCGGAELWAGAYPSWRRGSRTITSVRPTRSTARIPQTPTTRIGHPVGYYVTPSGAPAPAAYHPGGVNCAFADGSVHFIKNSIAPQTWWALGTRNVGEVVSSDAY